MKKIITTTILATLVVGCASSTGVLKKGADTYSITASSNTVSSAKKRAYKEANMNCNKMGKTIMVIEENLIKINDTGASNFELQFKCLAHNSPELKK